MKANEDLLTEIERQLDMGVDCVADKDKWMLEVDPVQLANFSLKEKQYWLYEVEAARQAGTRAMEVTEGATNDWAEAMKDETLSRKIPTMTPVPDEEAGFPGAAHSLLPGDEPEGARQEGAAQKRNHKKQKVSSPLPDHHSEEGTQESPEAGQLTGESTGQAAAACRGQGKRKTRQHLKAWGSLARHPKAPPAAGKLGGKKKALLLKKKEGRRAWGSLARASARAGPRLQVSREALEADGSSLGLFTRKDSLSTGAARNLLVKLNTPPR